MQGSTGTSGGIIIFYTSCVYEGALQDSRKDRGQMARGGQQSGTNGPHHCIATASTITDMIFRYLRARCSAQGGTLSYEDLDDACERFSESVPSGFDLFETIHLRCMQASGSTAATHFTRKALLTTLLHECGYDCAKASFTRQATQFGDPWMRYFFQGLSTHIREEVCKDADYQLIAAYVRAAKKLKNQLSAEELLKEQEIQAVLRGCVAELTANTASAEAGVALCEAVNRHTAHTRAAAGTDASHVSQTELQHFLGLITDELQRAPQNTSRSQ